MSNKQPGRSFFGIARDAPEGVELRWLLDTGVHLIGADEGSLLIYDPGKRALRFAMTAGSRRSERNLIGQTVPLSQGLAGLAAQLREVQVGAPKYHKIEQVGRRDGKPIEPRNVIAAPMVSRDQLVGVMTAVRFASYPLFTLEDGKLIGRFAAVAALVIDQHRRLEDAAARTTNGRRTKAAPADRHRRKIMAAVAEVERSRPAAMAQFARAVGAVAALIAGSTRNRDAVR